MSTRFLRRRLAVAGILMGLAGLVGGPAVCAAEAERAYSEFLKAVDAGEVTEVVIDGENVTWRDESGSRYETIRLDDPTLVRTLRDHGVVIRVVPEGSENPILYALINWFPMLMLIGVWIHFMRRMRSGTRKGGSGLQDLAAKLDDVNAHLTRIEGILATAPQNVPAQREHRNADA